MVSRREFVAASTLLTARAYSQVKGANDRLRIGVIGCGGMATGHMKGLVKNKEGDNAEIVTVCDIYDKRLEAAAQLTGGKPVRDYRSVLENPDVDYVLIATPEHWHAQMTLDAADAGKHIYCEKPMTKTTEEAKKVVAKIKQTGVKMQVGVQGMSDDSYETANKYVKEGVLGDVVIAQIDYSRNYGAGDEFWAQPPDADAKPGENLDWKAWLGPAPKRPWDPDRYFAWRRYWDYSSGIASDLFVHRITRIIKSLDLKEPERAVATGGKYHYKQSIAEIPDTFNVLLEYPGGPNVILISSMANDTPVEHVLRGHKATLKFTRTGFTITPQREFAKDNQDAREITHEKNGAESTELHHRNLQNAIRRNEPLKCDCQLGYYGVVACDMSTQSFRKREYVRWDAQRQRIVRA
jgi:predicted dehydrogenase